MPIDYTQLDPSDPNYVDPNWLAHQPEKVRKAFTGNYTPGGGGLLGTALKTVTSPISIGDKLVGSAGGHPGGLATGVAQWGTRNPAYWKHINQAMALFTGGYAIPAAAGAYGGGAALAGGGAGAGANASMLDPFVAGGGGVGWAPAGSWGATVPSAAGGVGGYYTPAGTWVSGTAGGDFGALGAAGTAGGAAGGAGSWMSTPWGQALVKGGLGFLANQTLNKPTSQENQLNASYADLQKYLPPGLANFDLTKGLQGIADLLANPGGLSPGVADAIRARLAAESQNIAQSYRGLASNQAGAAARGNLPVSLKVALQSALDIAQERAQRGARQEALTQSEQLRRQDLEQTFSVLSAILQYMQGGRTGAVEAAQMSAQRRAATLALISSLLTSIGNQKQGA